MATKPCLVPLFAHSSSSQIEVIIQFCPTAEVQNCKVKKSMRREKPIEERIECYTNRKAANVEPHYVKCK